MDTPHGIERTIDLDLPDDELWSLIGTADGWRRWMVDHAAVDLAVGGVGFVTDDGVRRAVVVDEVQAGTRISFHWSEVGRPDDLSRVTLELVPAAEGRRVLRITEQWLAPTACAECPLRSADRWDLRACLLCVRAEAVCRV